MFDGAAAALHGRLQQLLQVAQGFLYSASHCLCVGVLAAVKGSDGEVDMVRLRVVTHGITVRNEGSEAHDAVCVCGYLHTQKQEMMRLEMSF